MQDPIRALEDHCREFQGEEQTDIVWTVKKEGTWHTASVEVQILNVPHLFSGAKKSCEEEARRDTARRVLWYLQCPGFKDAYEADLEAAEVLLKKNPPLPATWTRTGEQPQGVDDASQLADRKTAVMRLQNRLQQIFSKMLKPGQSVLEWSYETDPSDDEWPLLYRASAFLPVVNRTFTGAWIRGQRDAQIDTCTGINEYLDALLSNHRIDLRGP